MLASEINLLPDSTFFFQLAIFLIVALVLNHFVFQPVLKLIELRRVRTKGEEKRIEDLIQKTEQLLKEYEEKMHHAKAEALKTKELLHREGEGQGRKILTEAKQASLAEIERMRKELEAAVHSARADLAPQAEELAKQLAEKVLGRPIH